MDSRRQPGSRSPGRPGLPLGKIDPSPDLHFIPHRAEFLNLNLRANWQPAPCGHLLPIRDGVLPDHRVRGHGEGIATNTVSNLVQQMVTAGLVERTPRPGDRKAGHGRGGLALWFLASQGDDDDHHGRQSEDSQPHVREHVKALLPNFPLRFASRQPNHLVPHTGNSTPQLFRSGNKRDNSYEVPRRQPLAGICGPFAILTSEYLFIRWRSRGCP